MQCSRLKKKNYKILMKDFLAQRALSILIYANMRTIWHRPEIPSKSIVLPIKKIVLMRERMKIPKC